MIPAGTREHRCQKQAPWRRALQHRFRVTWWAVRGFACFPSCLDPGNSQKEMPGGCEGQMELGEEVLET